MDQPILVILLISVSWAILKITPRFWGCLNIFLLYSAISNVYKGDVKYADQIFTTSVWVLLTYLFSVILEDTVFKKFVTPRFDIYIYYKKVFLFLIRHKVSLYWIAIYSFIARLIYLLIDNIYGLWHFYMTFFLQPELREFLWGPGIWYSVSIVLGFFMLYVMTKSHHKELGIIVSLILMLLIWIRIEDVFTRDIRDKVWIWDINPKRGTLWDTVKLDGVNFGEPPWYGEVKIGGVSHRIISWNNRKIEIELTPGESKSGDLEVTSYDGRVSNHMYFEVYDFFNNEIIN